MPDFSTKQLIESGPHWKKYHIRGMVHGQIEGQPIPNTSCGNYPNIWISMDVNCIRYPGSTTTTFDCTNISWEHEQSGSYGYYFQANVDVSVGETRTPTYNILSKHNVTKPNWWLPSVTTLSTPFTLSFDTTSNLVSFNIYAGGFDNEGCWNGGVTSGVPCYGQYANTEAGRGKKFLYSISLDLPPYAVDHLLIYSADSGVAQPPNPANQKVSQVTPTEIRSITWYPFVMNYRNGNTLVKAETNWRVFGGWKVDQTVYQNGDKLVIPMDAVAYAQWGEVGFTPPNITRKAYIKFHSNGGSKVSDIATTQNAKGYSFTDGGYQTYTVGVRSTYTPTHNNAAYVDLYAKFNTSTYDSSKLPIPTKSGCEFLGWYTNSELTNKATGTLTIEGTELHLYAKWKELPVKIKTSDGWSSKYKYVWRMTSTGWKREAPIYKLDSTGWKNISDS